MKQLFLLLVTANLVVGFALSANIMLAKAPKAAPLIAFLESIPVRITLSVVVIVIGLISLLTPQPGEIPVIGDIIPSVWGILMGGTFSFDLLMKKRSEERAPSKFERVFEPLFVKNKSVIGMIGMILAVVHFFVPGAILL